MYAWQYQQILSAICKQYQVGKDDSIIIDSGRLRMETMFYVIWVDLSKEGNFTIQDIAEVQKKVIFNRP